MVVQAQDPPAEAPPAVTAPAAALPPGPDGGRLAQTIRFHRDPLATLSSAQARFGDVFSVHLTLGRAVVVCDPAFLDELLASDPQRAQGGSARRRIIPELSPRSVLGADGSGHAEARGRVQHIFTTDWIDARRARIAAIVERHIAGWPTGRPMRLLPRLRALCDEVFATVVLGVHDLARAQAIARAVGRTISTPGNPPIGPPGLGDGLLGAAVQRAFDRRRAPLDAMLATELRLRRPGDDDLLGALAGSPGALDQLVPLLLAGQEPPAAGLAWLLDRAAREPGWAGALVEDGTRREAFVKEALRLRPAVVAAMRRPLAPLRVGDHVLPAGVPVMLPSLLLHRHPRAFADPERFRPQRFLEGDVRRAEAAILPFGGGARRCLGEPLAHALIEIVLPAVLRRLTLRPLSAQAERPVVRGTILVPQRSALMVATTR
jgi:cytochrome P450